MVETERQVGTARQRVDEESQRANAAEAAKGAAVKGEAEAKLAERTAKEGESFASAGGKKPVCIVTGGLGTTAVSYKGATYYVCCSGCREAFLEDPEKFIKEFNAKKK